MLDAHVRKVLRTDGFRDVGLQAVQWFSEVHGMVYRAEVCGASSDWLLDVVSVNYGSRAGSGKGFRSRDDVERASSLLPSRCPHLIKDAGALPEPCAGLPGDPLLTMMRRIWLHRLDTAVRTRYGRNGWG